MQGGWQSGGGWHGHPSAGGAYGSQPMAPSGMMPPYGSPQSSPTVARVPLMPGERVLYFKKPDLGMARVWYVIGGIVLLPMLLGIYLLYVAIFFEEKASHYWVITTLRLFTANARGGVLEQVVVQEISDVVHRVGGGKNQLVVHSPRSFITFRQEEQHAIQQLKPLLQSLRDPRFLQQAPAVPYEA